MQKFDILFKKTGLIAIVLMLAIAPSVLKAQTIYALSGTNLITFQANNPQLITGIVPISGITLGRTIVGMDIRPSNGELYILTYNSLDSTAIVHTVSKTTGLATALDSTVFLPLGGTRLGFDFNPVANKIS